MIASADVTGRLTPQAFLHDVITEGAAMSILIGAIVFAIFITYKRRWPWLWREWLTSVDPKRLGVMYILVALTMLVRSGFDVLLMRAQQATAVGSNPGVIPDSMFQQVFSAHGTLMIFFVAMGLMFGLINLVLPLQIGARDVAFPVLNAISFWLFASGMVLVNTSLGIGNFSAAGWLAYPPLSELQYSPGVGVDYWIWSLEIAGMGSLLASINFLVTIVMMRCPGMTWMKMPMFVWSVANSMFLALAAFPILTVTLTLLYLDRSIGTHFFTAGHGGNFMMYVNLIWAWGHPEVYILIMPAFGIFSEIVATFSRKPLFGYTSMVVALAVISLLSFSVWVHHFFTMGAGADVNGFFGLMTMLISIPTGVKIFNWLATMFRGRIRWATPMFWYMGFVGLFTVGGVAGVMLAAPAIDFQLHNSLFLVAHFHTMLVSGVLFADFAAMVYWAPKVLGFRLDERLGHYAYWCWFIGFLMVFVPLYLAGFMGATRRLSNYSASSGWQPLFLVAGAGALVIAAGVALQALQIWVSIRGRSVRRDATGDPWNGRTLEWSTSSPPPEYNFAILPEVSDRDAFWHAKQRGAGAEPTRAYEPIVVRQNTPAGLLIGLLAFVTGFGFVWHIYWLAVLGAMAGVGLVAIHTTSTDDSIRIIPVEEIELQESAAVRRVVVA